MEELLLANNAIIRFLKVRGAENVSLAQNGFSLHSATFLDVQWRKRTEAE